eukprot:g4803.t1
MRLDHTQSLGSFQLREVVALCSTTLTALLIPCVYYRRTPSEDIDLLTSTALALLGAVINFVAFVALEVWKQSKLDLAARERQRRRRRARLLHSGCIVGAGAGDQEGHASLWPRLPRHGSGSGNGSGNDTRAGRGGADGADGPDAPPGKGAAGAAGQGKVPGSGRSAPESDSDCGGDGGSESDSDSAHSGGGGSSSSSNSDGSASDSDDAGGGGRGAAGRARPHRHACSGVTLTVAAHSLRGYYPSHRLKPNQDMFLVRPEQGLFGVFDGHGRDGDLCARFAAKRLPRALQSHDVAGRGGVADGDTGAGAGAAQAETRADACDAHAETDSHSRFCRAMLGVNECMHASQYFNDQRSGSTAIVLQVGSEANGNGDGGGGGGSGGGGGGGGALGPTPVLHVANVGDSRAVLVFDREPQPQPQPKASSRARGAVGGRPPMVRATQRARGSARRGVAGEGTGEGVVAGGVSLGSSYNSSSVSRRSSRSSRAPRRPAAPAGSAGVLALSRDHTPFLADERRRVRGAGAVVRTMAQVQRVDEDAGAADAGAEALEEKEPKALTLGEDIDYEGDPPRVWAPKPDAHGHRYPGCAFTRSLGDRVAEGLGVCARPECLSRRVRLWPAQAGQAAQAAQPSSTERGNEQVLGQTDRCVILASDGVWEFLTSATVAAIVQQFAESEVEEACAAVVAEAYRQWLMFEERTDDITIVLVRIAASFGAACEKQGEESAAGAAAASATKDSAVRVDAGASKDSAAAQAQAGVSRPRTTLEKLQEPLSARASGPPREAAAAQLKLARHSSLPPRTSDLIGGGPGTFQDPPLRRRRLQSSAAMRSLRRERQGAAAGEGTGAGVGSAAQLAEAGIAKERRSSGGDVVKARRGASTMRLRLEAQRRRLLEGGADSPGGRAGAGGGPGSSMSMAELGVDTNVHRFRGATPPPSPGTPITPSTPITPITPVSPMLRSGRRSVGPRKTPPGQGDRAASVTPPPPSASTVAGAGQVARVGVVVGRGRTSPAIGAGPRARQAASGSRAMQLRLELDRSRFGAAARANTHAHALPPMKRATDAMLRPPAQPLAGQRGGLVALVEPAQGGTSDGAGAGGEQRTLGVSRVPAAPGMGGSASPAGSGLAARDGSLGARLLSPSLAVSTRAGCGVSTFTTSPETPTDADNEQSPTPEQPAQGRAPRSLAIGVGARVPVVAVPKARGTRPSLRCEAAPSAFSRGDARPVDSPGGGGSSDGSGGGGGGGGTRKRSIGVVRLKTAKEEARLARALRGNLLFTHLQPEAHGLSEAQGASSAATALAARRREVFALLEPMAVRAGEVVIRQRAAADYIYVVDRGVFDVFVMSERRLQEADTCAFRKGEGFSPAGAGPPSAAGLTEVMEMVTVQLEHEALLDRQRKQREQQQRAKLQQAQMQRAHMQQAAGKQHQRAQAATSARAISLDLARPSRLT